LSYKYLLLRKKNVPNLKILYTTVSAAAAAVAAAVAAVAALALAFSHLSQAIALSNFNNINYRSNNH
jgi:hypothetical protein